MLKNTHAKKPYTPTILLPWILIAVGLLIACFTITFSLWRTNNQPPKLASREDVAKLQTIVADIKSKLDDDRAEWRDNSSCTIIEPRLFGEVERYYCTVEFSRAYSVATSEKSVVHTIDSQQQALSKVEQVTSPGKPTYPRFTIQAGAVTISSSTGSSTFSIKSLPDAHCATNYVVSFKDDHMILNEDVGCNIDTSGVYLQRTRKV